MPTSERTSSAKERYFLLKIFAVILGSIHFNLNHEQQKNFQVKGKRFELERAVSGVATNTIKQVNKAPVSTNKTGNLILGVY